MHNSDKVTQIYVKRVVKKGIKIHLVLKRLPKNLTHRLGKILDKIARIFPPSIILMAFLLYHIKVKPVQKNIYSFRGYGVEMLVPCDSWGLFNEILLNEAYERMSKVEKGGIVIDIGAHVGVFTVKAAKAVGEEGLVVAIEPEPRNMALLSENVAKNGLDNVMLIEKAVGGYKGKAKLYINTGSEGHSIVIPKSGEHIEVDVDMLDNIASELRLEEVDFIKIDAEGAELEVLHGARKVLNSPSLKLAIEFHSRYPEAPRLFKILSCLKSEGFKTFVEETYVYAKSQKQ